MKVCTQCVLPETFPGIRFDGDGVCNHCREFVRKRDKHADGKDRYRRKFLDVLTLSRKRNRRPHDVIMAYSGGKDSTYTLKILKEWFDLRILAVTFNQGFISPQALENIDTTVKALNVDHIMLSPGRDTLTRAFNRSATTEIYPLKSLERASAICNTCMNLVKASVLKTAVEKGVPFIAYGWSPGQAPLASSVMRLNDSMIRQMQEALLSTLGAIMEEEIKPYLLEQRHYRQLLSTSSDLSEGGHLYALHPLAFLEYKESAVLEEIRPLGWKDPKDTDPNSTNCLLNAFANQVHLDRYGFHPYAFEIAGLVREGCLSREEGLEKLSATPDTRAIRSVRKKLGLPDDYDFHREVNV